MGEHTISQNTPPAAAAPPTSPPTASQDPSIPKIDTTVASTTSTAPAKIPFRPRKVRKVADGSDATAAAAPSKQIVLRALPSPLNADGEIAAALRHLRAADPSLARVMDAHDLPSFQTDLPPFQSLARSILYQQLAFKAATAIYSRFLALCGSVSPEAVLALTPHHLRQIGVSARKASYLHDLARKFHTGILSDASIVAMDDKSLFSMLTMVKGIGAWSVHMFMIFTLHRPDVLPVGDLGVRKGVQMLYGLEDVPRPSQMEQLCELWRPYRSVGAWYMWRLVEQKGTLTLPPAGAGGIGVAGGMLGGGAQLPGQSLLIDPIQMMPDLG